MTEFTGKIGKIFGLDADALELCAFAFCMENYDLPQNYFEDALELQNFENTRLMAKALSVSPYRYRQVESALIKMNILHTGRYRDAPRLIDSIEEAIRDVANKNLLPFFCQPLRRSTVSMDQFRLEEEDKRHVVRLLGARNGNPLHILLYGAPGSGKTSFASTLAQSLGLQAWAVPCREKDSTADRRVSLAACLRLAARHPRSFVLVDEAEKLLDTYSFKEGSSKAWLNDLLETRGARVIWISNEVSQLDHAVRRRFSYSLFFGDPGPVERERMWDMVAKKLRVTSRLPEETRKRFAEKYPVPVATIESATRQAKSLNVGREFSDYVERCLKSQMILRNDGHGSAPSILIEGNYDPEAATTKIPLEEIVRKTRALAKRLEAGDAPMACGGTMLLWGPPGTGKTAFGKYLAKTLGYQCLNYRASDLVVRYVGQTEQRIA
ncbi:MAG: AAA family ATPase, partial [Desulfovibrio sp.]|nr:AAA family ATPase [Desulfovibrio sp.]